jgi:hypothetical protein
MDPARQEKESLISAIRLMNVGGDGVASEQETKRAVAVLEHEWMDDARKDPDSLAGQLSRMVTQQLFHSHEMNSKTAFLLQNHHLRNNITFREGSCRVNNVALLSARAVPFLVEQNEPSSDNKDSESISPRYTPITDYDETADDDVDSSSSSNNSKTAVAAQLEVLYDVTQEFMVTKSSLPLGGEGTLESKDPSSSESETESKQTTIVSVATFEGWLKGGPDKELRWKLALHRPAFEFPGIEQAY